MVINNRSLFIVFFLSSLLLPQLPIIFGRSEFHINIYVFIFSVLILCKYQVIDRYRSFIPIAYFLVFQLLLMCSYWFGVEELGEISDIPSYYRPVMLMVITLAFLSLMHDYESVYKLALRAIKAIVLMVFTYSFFEVFFLNELSSLMFTFYRMEDKSNINGVAVSFFTLPYYAAYILNTFLVFLLSNYKINKSFVSALYVLICIISVIFTQSKMGIALTFSIFFLFYFMRSKFFSKTLICFLFFVFVVILYRYLYDVVSFMYSNYGGNLFSTLYVMLKSPEQSGNLMERVNDIHSTYELIITNNIFVGVGLGKGVTIETWIASLMYRYGFIGLALFIITYISMGLYSWRLYSIEKNIYRAELLNICSIWALTIFISQLSGLMMEISKNAVVTCFMFALTSFVMAKNNKKNLVKEGGV